MACTQPFITTKRLGSEKLQTLIIFKNFRGSQSNYDPIMAGWGQYLTDHAA
jgi:hypothetical protein